MEVADWSLSRTADETHPFDEDKENRMNEKENMTVSEEELDSSVIQDDKLNNVNGGVLYSGIPDMNWTAYNVQRISEDHYVLPRFFSNPPTHVNKYNAALYVKDYEELKRYSAKLGIDLASSGSDTCSMVKAMTSQTVTKDSTTMAVVRLITEINRIYKGEDTGSYSPTPPSIPGYPVYIF